MESFLQKIYLARFLDSFILIGVIFTLLFNRAGLSPFQISWLIAIWSITTITLEVPTGVLADKFSRRNLLIIGLLIRAIAFCFWIAGGFLNYAIGFFLWGVKNTLHSGTTEAFVYDELKSFHQEQTYEKVNGKMTGIFSIGLILSAIFGGFLAEYSFNLVLIASIFTTLLSVLTLLTIRSVKSIESTGESQYFSILKEAIQQIKTTPALIFIIALICIVFAAYGAADEYWALIYQNFGLSLRSIGFLVSFVYGLFSLAGYTVSYFNRFRVKNIEYYLLLTAGSLFVLAGALKSIPLLPLAFLAIYLTKVANLKMEARLQHQIKAHQRATISSIKSLVFELFYMGFVLLFGFIADKSGVISILPITGGLILSAVVFFASFRSKLALTE